VDKRRLGRQSLGTTLVAIQRSFISCAARSAITTVSAFVFPLVIVGMIEASTTRKFLGTMNAQDSALEEDCSDHLNGSFAISDIPKARVPYNLKVGGWRQVLWLVRLSFSLVHTS
jgi:hypothetical protein